MKVWKVVRISTFDDDELANKITEIDNIPGQKVKEVIYFKIIISFKKCLSCQF